MMSPAEAVLRVWQRYFAVFRKNLIYGVVTTFLEPILYLLSFGFGVGSMVKQVEFGGHPIAYRPFVLAGIIGQTLLMQGFFEAAYGSFIRMYYQKVFQAIAVTPVTLSQVLWGELLWDASKSVFSASAVLLIGILIGDFPIWPSVLLIPLAFFFGLMFASLGVLVAAKSRTIESISYPQYLLIFPMFLFCGVFFPLTNLPAGVQWVAEVLPLTHVLSVVRALTLGVQLPVQAIPVLLVWTSILVLLSRRAMLKRLIP